MTSELEQARAAVKEANAAIDQHLFHSEKPMQTPTFAGMLANVADKQAALIAALEAALEARAAEKAAAVKWLKELTVAARDEDFDSTNWASNWRELQATRQHDDGGG